MRGASLLEFATVATVGGAVAAVLLSVLPQVQSHAREARLVAAARQVQAAATLFNARCLVQSATAPTAKAAPRPVPPLATDCSQLQIGDQPVAGTYGWPDASPEGILRAAGLPLRAQREDGFLITVQRRDGVATLAIGLPASTAARCQFTYAQAPRPGAQATVDISTLSCS